jgi:hypothetical protein
VLVLVKDIKKENVSQTTYSMTTVYGPVSAVDDRCPPKIDAKATRKRYEPRGGYGWSVDRGSRSIEPINDGAREPYKWALNLRNYAPLFIVEVL